MTIRTSSESQTGGSLKVSVAIPLYNEETVLPELHRRLAAVLDGVAGGPHEIVFVDDGSTDTTRELLAALVVADPRVKVVLLSRNFGHQAALSAALDHVSGDAVVLMDGDLQDTPESIPRFVDKYLDGFDVVYAIREKRKESVWLRAAYAGFYAAISQLSDIKLPKQAGDFSLLSRRVVAQLKAMPERHRYLRGLRTWVGYRQVGIVIERDARHSGVSKYSLRKLFQLAFDGILSFSTKPIRAAVFGGMFAIACSIVFATYAVVSQILFHQSPPGFTAIIGVMTFLTGVQLFFLGVIGEYVGRIYEQVKSRPMYLVDSVLTVENVNLETPELWGAATKAASEGKQQLLLPTINLSTLTNHGSSLRN